MTMKIILFELIRHRYKCDLNLIQCLQCRSSNLMQIGHCLKRLLIITDYLSKLTELFQEFWFFLQLMKLFPPDSVYIYWAIYLVTIRIQKAFHLDKCNSIPQHQRGIVRSSLEKILCVKMSGLIWHQLVSSNE